MHQHEGLLSLSLTSSLFLSVLLSLSFCLALSLSFSLSRSLSLTSCFTLCLALSLRLALSVLLSLSPSCSLSVLLSLFHPFLSLSCSLFFVLSLRLSMFKAQSLSFRNSSYAVHGSPETSWTSIEGSHVTTDRRQIGVWMQFSTLQCSWF